MRKLMIAAAAVAMGTGAFAASTTSLEAQVYDVNLTVKSTACKEIKYTKAIAYLEYGILPSSWNDFKKVVGGEKITVRKQASTKIAGVIWGCECETIADPDWRLYNNGRTVGGYLFWNVGGEHPFNIYTTRFRWALLNRIDNGEKAEGVWGLINSDAENTLGFLGAGFGKVNGIAGCRTVLSNMSGNFAGFILAGSDAGGCKFCGGMTCTAWQICEYCTDAYYGQDLTAAYGTWKIKYNKSASVKLRKNGYITQSYNFKKAGDTAAIFAKVEYAAANGLLSEEDEDDESFEQGVKIEATAIADAAYGTIEDGEIVPGVPPEEYAGDNPLVQAILDAMEPQENPDDPS